MIFENQAPKSISFQGEEEPLSAWVGTPEIEILLMQSLFTHLCLVVF